MSNPVISLTFNMAKQTDAVELTILDEDKAIADEAEKREKIIEVRCTNIR